MKIYLDTNFIRDVMEKRNNKATYLIETIRKLSDKRKIVEDLIREKGRLERQRQSVLDELVKIKQEDEKKKEKAGKKGKKKKKKSKKVRKKKLKKPISGKKKVKKKK
mgnify:CR=1 FL=1